MPHNYKGCRYIYHYHIFNNTIQNFEKNINTILKCIPNIANTHIESFYSEGIGIGYIDEELESNQYKNALLNYVKDYYQINEIKFLDFLGKDIYSNFTSFLLAPIIFVIDDKASYYYMTLKIFKQGYFYIELIDNLDNLSIHDDGFNISVNANKNDYILYPKLNKRTNKIEYEKREFNTTDGDDSTIEFPITEYYDSIVEVVKDSFKSSTSDSFYTLFILDNEMHDGVNVKEEQLKSLVTAPIHVELGNNFTHNIDKINFNHFTILGNINRLLFSVISNKYNIKKKDYKENKIKYRAVNNAFILAALNSLYIKRSILKFKANITYNSNILDDIKQRQIENILMNGLIQGYSVNYLPVQNLREELENDFINPKEFEEIDNIYDQYLLVVNSKRQHKIEQKLRMGNNIVLILTTLSIIDILTPFITDKVWLAAITTFFIIFTLVIYISYSYKIDNDK